MPTVLLLITLAQLQGLSMWTDASGVVHVASSAGAPRSAVALEGGSYSIIDGDGRPEVLADGGTRAADKPWWRERFAHARETVVAARALEAAAAREVNEAGQTVCATARAEAVARTPITVRGPQVEVRATDTATQCTRGVPSTGAREAAAARRAERERAEVALRKLEQQALAEHVPLRDWY